MTDKKSKLANLEKYTTAMALKDGSMINLRAISVDDASKLLSFYQRLSSRSIYLRFLKMINLTKEDADQYAKVDYDNTFAVVAIHGEGPEEKIIGVGRYWRHPEPHRNKAEMAFVVEDAYQKKGIGTNLLELLAVAAREHGIDTIET
jgi:GNAT superfamily N-acetyltransferase